MGLEKAFIVNTVTGDKIEVLFNPAEYTFEKSNRFAEVGIPGTGSPFLQFIRGDIKRLSTELFFDTYEKRTDVREYTNKITGLLDIEPSTHAPPVCLFSWSKMQFTCVLENFSQRFTMFLESGIPVRTTLSVTFKEYTAPEIETRRMSLYTSDYTTYRVVKEGDTLSGIAGEEYKDPGKWRQIADFNGIDNPGMLKSGQVLTIPGLS